MQHGFVRLSDQSFAHNLPRSEIRGEHSPLRAGLHDVQDAVKNRAQRIFSESFFGIQHIFITCHCLSVRLVGYLCMTLMS